MEKKITAKENFRRLQKKIILEIGHGGVPFMNPKLLEKILGEGKVYIGIDIEPEAVDSLKSLKEVFKGNIVNLQGSAENLPLKDNTVNKIYLYNFFGDPRIGLLQTPLNDIEVNHQFEIMKKYFSELVRVLKPEGEIYLVEIYTPPPILKNERIIDFFKSLGLTIKRILTEKDSIINFLNLPTYVKRMRTETLVFILIKQKAGT